MTPEDEWWIDNASLEALLRRWRFAPCGDPIFEGDAAGYYEERMESLRRENPEEWTAASKRIGWEKP